MRLMPPQCGNDREAHEPHRFAMWSADTGQHGSCGGFTVEQAFVHDMFRAVREGIDQRELATRRPAGPDALRLEIHPAIRYMVLRSTVPSPAENPADLRVFGVPLVPVGDLETNRWRLIELGPVLAEGPAAERTAGVARG